MIASAGHLHHMGLGKQSLHDTRDIFPAIVPVTKSPVITPNIVSIRSKKITNEVRKNMLVRRLDFPSICITRAIINQKIPHPLHENRRFSRPQTRQFNRTTYTSYSLFPLSFLFFKSFVSADDATRHLNSTCSLTFPNYTPFHYPRGQRYAHFHMQQKQYYTLLAILQRQEDTDRCYPRGPTARPLLCPSCTALLAWEEDEVIRQEMHTTGRKCMRKDRCQFDVKPAV